MQNPMRFEGQVAYVLGGGAAGPPQDSGAITMGNGRAIALRLAEEGAMVAVGDRSPEGAAVTVDAIECAGGSAFAVEVHADDPDSCRAAVSGVLAETGRLDVVIANVGIHGNMRLRQQTVEDWDLSVNVNARAHWITAQACLEHMVAARSGAFVFVASTAAERSSGTSVSYEATKAAQLAIMRHVAVRYSSRGIRSNAVVLGVIDTGMVRSLFGDGEDKRSGRAGMAPIGREGRPAEVGKAVAFLASDDASYVNGATLHVDGGLSALSPSYRSNAG